ncbi:MAG TPA: glycoside hydrolase family 88 protein [Verrucomicrobiae bacterium]|jgi:rhamnogalacturonyl hydrolase YesR
MRLLRLALFLLVGCRLSAQTPWPDAGSVAEAMSRANNYWIAHNPVGDSGWARGAYYSGNQRAARVLTQRSYVNWAFTWGAANQWLIGPEGASSANAYCCGQTYLDLYQLNPQLTFITDITNRVNAWVAAAATNQLTWIDAFYMAGPTFARMGHLTGNTNYYQKLWQMYSYMKDGLALFDPAESLWYRDTTYLYPAHKTANGQKIFWARGNGWVFAGLARVIEQMPANAPHYSDYVAMFQAMAPAIKAVQGLDGMWRTSLYDAAQYPGPETSGTGFFTYGLAWGVRNGFLPASDYTNSITLAWQGLTNLALNASGFVGYVQIVAAAPGVAYATNTADFGVGAFLLAGSEMYLGATNAPPLSAWAGPDQTINANTNTGTATVNLDATATEIYRGTATSFTWWEGTNQIAAGLTAQVALPLGQHGITVNVLGSDGLTYTDTASINVVIPFVPPPPTLKLRFNFSDSGTATTDMVAGVSLNLINATGVATDLHGAAGSGVAGYGQSLDFRSAVSQGGSGPFAFATNNAALNFGVVSNFTLTLWIKPATNLLASAFPRFFSLGANGLQDRGVVNSFQLLSNGNDQSGTTSVQGFVNTTQTSTSGFGAFAMPTNRWSFLALVYDGSTLKFYGGSETNPVRLSTSVSFAAGILNLSGPGNILLGNCLLNAAGSGSQNRAFKGQFDDVRFYTGAGDTNFLENVRQSVIAPAPPLITCSPIGSNLQLQVNDTLDGAKYILQAATNLNPPVGWAPVTTNFGNGSTIINTLPSGPGNQFFRYVAQ